MTRAIAGLALLLIALLNSPVQATTAGPVQTLYPTTPGNCTQYDPNSTGGTLSSFATPCETALYNRVNPTGPYSANCGDAISAEGAQAPGYFIVLTLPQNPIPDCTVLLFPHKLYSFYVLPIPLGTTNTSGMNYIKTGQFDVDGTALYIPGSWAHRSVVFRYAPGGLGWVSVSDTPPSTIWRYNLHNGAVRFDRDLSNTQTRLCPDGDGGLITHRLLFYTPPSCVPLPDSAVTSLGANTFQYVYTIRQNDDLVSAVCAGANNSGCPCPDIGKLCLTVATTIGFYSGVPLTAVNFFGTPWTSPSSVGANVTDDPNTVLVDSTHIEISDVTYVAAETNYGNKVQPFVAYVGLVPDVATPVLDPIDEVMVNPDLTGKTLVGAIYVDANSAIVDSPCERNVASYYNAMPKQMRCVLATSTVSQNKQTYQTPAAPFQGQFISFAQPNGAGNASIPWSLSVAASTSSVTAPTTGAAVVFDVASRAGYSTCTVGSGSPTPEAPDVQEVMPQTKIVYASASGVTTAAVQGREVYIHLCYFESDNSTINILGTDVVTTSPGATVLIDTLMQ